MINSIHTPLSGALAQDRVLEIIANNMANSNTAGFKGDRITFTVLEPEPEKRYSDPLPPANYKVGIQDLQYLKGNEILYVGVADVRRDHTQGPAIQTHNPLDFQIEGNGMFEIQTPDGPRYTRNGSFSLSKDGIIVNKDGFPVLGQKGTIPVKYGQFDIRGGNEIWQNGKFVDKITLWNFTDESTLERVGNNMFFFGGSNEQKIAEKSPMVHQGWLEGSNINAIKNLTDLIIAHRSYESYQKAVSQYDQMMQKTSNSIGSVRA